MRFSILKKWSHIIHRRGRSDSHLHFVQSTTQADYPQSISVGNINAEQLDVPTVILDLSSSHAPSPSWPHMGYHVLPSTTPRPVLPDDQLPQSSYKTTTNVPQKLATAKRRISQLEKEKDTLDIYLKDLKASSSVQQKRLEQFRRELQSSRSSCQTEKNRIREVDSQAQRDHHRQLFANALLELGISNSSEVGTFLNASEDEIVDAVLKAVERDNSVWCSILTDIVGPIAPENYVSAVNIALNTRKELRSVRKVARFWKRTANSSGDLTPSTSNISDVQEPLSLERRQAVESLQRQRRGLSINSSVPELTFLPPTSVSSEISTALPYMSSTHTISSSYKRDSLPPLASQVFREELVNAHASSTLFTSSSSKHTFKQKTDTATENKALGKRKDIASVDLSASISQSHSSPTLRSAVGLHVNFLPYLDPLSPITGIFLDEAKEMDAPESTFLQAERALQSFERICNSFPSSNFGSLQIIDEELSNEGRNQDINDSTLVNATCLGLDPRPISSSLNCELSFHETDKSGECRLAKCEAMGSDTQLPTAASIGTSSTLLSLPSLPDMVDTSVSRLRGSFAGIPHMKPVAPLKIVKKNRTSLCRDSAT